MEHRSNHLQLLPIALAAVVFGTAVPVDFRAPVMWSLGFDSGDFAGNVLLYIPLGLVLWRRHLVASLAGAAILSTAIEILQIWQAERYGSLVDVLANVLGTAAGVTLARWMAQTVSPDTLPVDWRVGTGAVVGIMALLTIWTVHAQPSDLSNWDPDFELLLGNERTSDRPWRGTISALAIVPAPLSRQEVRALGNLADPGVRAALGSRGAYLLPEVVTLEGNVAKPFARDVSRRFFDLAVKRAGFAVIARVTTADAHQEGPARLISFSLDPFNRNFDLGQENLRLVFRVRTLTTGPNGMKPYTKTSPVLEAYQPVTVVATFDGKIARVYVDGQLRGRSNLAAVQCVIPTLCDTGLPIASAFLGGLLAIVAVAIGRPPSRARAVTLATLAGVLGAALLRLLPASLPFDGWTSMMVLAGAICIGVGTLCRHQTIGSKNQARLK